MEKAPCAELTQTSNPRDRVFDDDRYDRDLTRAQCDSKTVVHTRVVLRVVGPDRKARCERFAKERWIVLEAKLASLECARATIWRDDDKRLALEFKDATPFSVHEISGRVGQAIEQRANGECAARQIANELGQYGRRAGGALWPLGGGRVGLAYVRWVGHRVMPFPRRQFNFFASAMARSISARCSS